jgi:5'-3' exonuclease
MWVHDREPHPGRKFLFQDYKRKHIPPEKELEEEAYREAFLSQACILLPLLPTLAVHTLLGPYESDDTIGYLVQGTNQLGLDTVICTEDRDFCQLVGPLVSIYSLEHGQVFLSENIREWCEWSPNEVLLAKAILGDRSDNIPSACKGLGPVGLRKLFDEIHGELSFDALVEKSRELGKKYGPLASDETRYLVDRNLSLIHIPWPLSEEEIQYLHSEWNRPLSFDVFHAHNTLTNLGLSGLIESEGSWSRYCERLS